MYQRAHLLALVITLFAGIGATHAQTDLSRTWTFKGQQSVSGRLYSNVSPKSVTIKQEAHSITMNKTTAGRSGDVTSTETVGFSGTLLATTTGTGKKKTTTGQWSADKKNFTEVTQVFDATDSTRLIFKTTDIWSIEGGELILDRKAENLSNGETWESKATYDKQYRSN